MKSLTNYSPRIAKFESAWKHLDNLNLADDDPMGSDSIDLLLGADLYSSIILNGVRKGAAGQPIAQNSHFGWVISGPTTSQTSIYHSITVMHCSLDQELHRFWEIEESPSSSILSPDEGRCEEHFLATHSRDSSGRYIVRLPFKEGPPINIGDSRSTALRMLTSLNRRLDRYPELKQNILNFCSNTKI